MKYIDAEKLKEKIQPLYEEAKKKAHFAAQTGTSSDCTRWDEAKSDYGHVLWLIDTLQQGQPEPSNNLVDVDAVREDFITEVYRVLDADSTNDRANAIIDAFDSLLTVTQERPEADLEKVYDAYCKVCGHYHHTTPAHICRQACDYFRDFKALLNARKEE